MLRGFLRRDMRVVEKGEPQMKDAPKEVWIDRNHIDSKSTVAVLPINVVTSDYNLSLVSDVKYIRADLVPQWQPIETAPSGTATANRASVYWMMLALPDGEGGCHAVSGMRIGCKFYAALTFYSGFSGTDKNFELREQEVIPTHWQPLPQPPA